MSGKLKTKVCKNIRSLRKKSRMSQQVLADKSKISIRLLNKLENQAHNLTLDNIESLAKGLKVSVHEIVCGKDSPRVSKKVTEEFDDAMRILQSYRELM